MNSAITFNQYILTLAICDLEKLGCAWMLYFPITYWPNYDLDKLGYHISTLTCDLDKLGYHISPISIALSTISISLIIHIFYIKHRTTYDLDNLGYYNSNCPTYDLDEFGYGYPISQVIPEVLDLSHPWLLLQLRVYPCYIGMQLILQK